MFYNLAQLLMKKAKASWDMIWSNGFLVGIILLPFLGLIAYLLLMASFVLYAMSLLTILTKMTENLCLLAILCG